MFLAKSGKEARAAITHEWQQDVAKKSPCPAEYVPVRRYFIAELSGKGRCYNCVQLLSQGRIILVMAFRGQTIEQGWAIQD